MVEEAFDLASTNAVQRGIFSLTAVNWNGLLLGAQFVGVDFDSVRDVLHDNRHLGLVLADQRCMRHAVL